MIKVYEGGRGTGRSTRASALGSDKIILNCFISSTSLFSVLERQLFPRLGAYPSLLGMSASEKARYIVKMLLGALGDPRGFTMRERFDPPLVLVFDHADSAREWSSSAHTDLAVLQEAVEDLDVEDLIRIAVVCTDTRNISKLVGDAKYEVEKCTFPKNADEITTEIARSWGVPEKFYDFVVEKTILNKSLSYAENLCRIAHNLHSCGLDWRYSLRRADEIALPFDYRSRLWGTDIQTAAVLYAFVLLSEKHVAVPAKAVVQQVSKIRKLPWRMPLPNISKTQVYTRLRMAYFAGFFERGRKYGVPATTNYITRYSMRVVKEAIERMFFHRGGEDEICYWSRFCQKVPLRIHGVQKGLS